MTLPKEIDVALAALAKTHEVYRPASLSMQALESAIDTALARVTAERDTARSAFAHEFNRSLKNGNDLDALRAKAMALVDALPKCTEFDGARVQCKRPRTRFVPSLSVSCCDECARGTTWEQVHVLPYAIPLRALLAALAGTPAPSVPEPRCSCPPFADGHESDCELELSARARRVAKE